MSTKTKKGLLSGWFEAPFWNTRITSANVHGKERWLGYVAGPFGVMLLQSIVNSYFNKYLVQFFFYNCPCFFEFMNLNHVIQL